MKLSTKVFIRALLFATVSVSVAAAPAVAQSSQRGQPRTAFSVADFAKLRWLEGTWQGTSADEPTTYQKYVVSNDSTIDITYYSDASLAHPTNTGRLYLSVARVWYTFGPGRWGATHVDTDGVFLVPQVSARSTFSWSRDANDTWTSTQRSGVSGRDRVTVYHMSRMKS